jgi:membrane protein insertase Oxa1/YidC/SpoIIIJ
MLYDYTLYPIESILEILLVISIGLTGSYFWSIIALAFLVRLSTRPLERITSAAILSQAMIEAVLRPQLDAIKRESSGSHQHDAIIRLYSRYAYHPVYAVRSLFGLIVQLPFFIAAYFMLSGFENMSGVIVPLLGDLGESDTLLFGRFHLAPLIMTLVNILALLTQDGVNRKSFIQGLLISFVFFVLLYDTPLGLILYWTASNFYSLISNLFPRVIEKASLRKALAPLRGAGIGRVFEEYGYIFFVINLAILIPLFGVLGDQFNLFTAHGMTRQGIISSFLIVMFLPPIVLMLLRWLAKIAGVVKVFDGIVLAIFLGIFLTYIFNKVGYGITASIYEPAVLFFIALLATAGTVAVILRCDMLKKLSYFSFIIPLVFLHFIFVSPASTLLQGSGGLAGAVPENGNDTPVFVLVFDEFSGLTIQNADGVLDVSRFPGFAKIAKNADYFPNALTADYHTDISVPSIVSGTLRSDDRPGLAPGENLIELFQASGGGVQAVSSVLSADLMDEQVINLYSFASDIATLYLHIISHKDWIENKIGAIPSAWKGFGVFYEAAESEEVVDQPATVRPRQLVILFDWLEKLAAESDNKQFNFLHIEYPHVPYVTTATGRTQQNSELLRKLIVVGERLRAEQSIVNVSYHNYLQQASYAGILLERFIGVLKEAGLYDKSLIIVTADHGVSYNVEGFYRRDPLSSGSWKNIMSVPLIVKYPFQQKGRVDESYVTTLDIAPTIMDVTGIDPPWDLAGESLRGISAEAQTDSVELIPGYIDYFAETPALFGESRSIKKELFGSASPVAQIAVNYTGDSAYSTLLNTELADNSVAGVSELNALWDGFLTPREITHFGTIYLGTQPQDHRVIAAVIDNKIQAVFKTGNIGEQSGKFAFSLPEPEVIPVEFAVALYEVEVGERFVLKELRAYGRESVEFQAKNIVEYDWANSVSSTNGLDSVVVEDESISVLASSSTDPFLVMRPISNNAISAPTIRIELQSNRDLVLQLFYKTAVEPSFSESKSLKQSISEGGNDVYIKIPETDVSGTFRIDLGRGGFTDVHIENIEVGY